MHVAMGLLGFTKIDSCSSPPVNHNEGDPQGYLGKRVVLGGLQNIELNGANGVVKSRHALAGTYEVILDQGRRVVHVPPRNLLLVFTVENPIARDGGEFDQVDVREKELGSLTEARASNQVRHSATPVDNNDAYEVFLLH